MSQHLTDPKHPLDQTEISSEQIKTSDCWTLGIEISPIEIQSGRWTTTEWKIIQLWPDRASAEKDLQTNPDNRFITFLDLQLYRDERTAYRFNLNSVVPHLFVQCDEDEADSSVIPNEITAAQDTAGAWLDGEHVVLEYPMPDAIQCWLEAYMAEHGELIEQKKKRRYAELDKEKDSGHAKR